ncbi:MAG TPA: hypothetical protein VIP98_19555 [Microlunatus sp.]
MSITTFDMRRSLQPRPRDRKQIYRPADLVMPAVALAAQQLIMVGAA